MAADVALEPNSSNNCCAKLKEKYLKVKGEKDKLKHYFKEVTGKCHALIDENLQFKQARVKQEEEKANESHVRQQMEKEIQDLKAEISSYKKEECLMNANDDEKTLLNARISECQDEIKSLKELLQKEKKKSGREAKKADMEKEIQDLKAEIASYQTNERLMNANDDEKRLLNARISACQVEIKNLKELLQKEKKKSDSEEKKAELEKKRAAEAWKLLKTEKSKTEEQIKLVEIERKKAEEYRLCIENANKKNIEEQRKLTEFERKKSEEYRIRFEKAKAETKETREKLHAELSKADEARKRVEGEKQKTSIAKAQADSQTMRIVELEKLMETEKQRALNENIRAGHLSQLLEEEKRRSQELQKKMAEILSDLQETRGLSNGEERRGGDLSIVSANMKLVREQLKLEKKKAKYAERLAELEKAEKIYVMRELHTLKHSIVQIVSRFNMLDDNLPSSIVGTDHMAKDGKVSEGHSFKLKNNLLVSKRGQHNSKIDCRLTEHCCMGPFNFTEPTREFVGLPLTRGSCTRPTSGIISELESSIGGSDRNKSQSSAICSNTSYSDKRSMGSQERGPITVTASSKLTKKHPNKRPTGMKPSNEVAKTREINELDIMANSAGKTCGCREFRNEHFPASMHDEEKVVIGEFERNSKRRKVQDTIEPITKVHTKNNQSHFEIGGKTSAFIDILSKEGGVSAVNRSPGSEISKILHSEIVCPRRGHHESCKQICNFDSNTMAGSKQRTSVLQVPGQRDNSELRGKFPSQRNMGLSFIVETTPSLDQLKGNICIEQEATLLNSEQTDLISFEKMIRGNCLKLLNLDSDTEEERYRMAVEMPLSPMPDFKLPDPQLCVENDAQCVMERDKPLPSHSVDVMVTDISASNAASNLPPHEGKDSLYPAEDMEKTRVAELQHWVNQHDKLDAVEDNTLFSKKHRYKQTYRPGKQLDNKIDTVMVDHEAFANLSTGRDSGSDVIDEPQLVGDMAGCDILQDDGCLKSATGKTDLFKIGASLVANRENQACQRADIIVSALAEDHIDGEVDIPNDAIFSSSKKQMLGSEIRMFSKSDNNIVGAEISRQNNIHNLSDTSKLAPLPTSCNIEDFGEVEGTAVCHVVLPNIEDKDSISRIIQMRSRLTCRSFMVSQVDHVVVEVHNTLAINTALLPEEKASLFFSLLLCNITNRMSANFGSIVGKHHSTCIQPFAAEINIVLSNVETKSLFKEICPLDVLANLIEDFLIERKVIICPDITCEHKNSFSERSQLDIPCEFSRTATIDQFVTGCVILASISAAAGRTGFLLEASYKILLLCRNDSSWVLLALHIFASVCGNDFFNVGQYSFLIIALRSVVLLIEEGKQSVPSVSCYRDTVFATERSFPPCDKCPFSVGAVCMDKLIRLLLDVLQCYILGGIECSDINRSDELSVCMIPSQAEREEEGRASKTKIDGQITTCIASCRLFMFRKHVADLPDYFPDQAFCHFNDIVSLVELISGYMSWEWTYGKIIPRLSDMLESCKHDELSAALFVLFGQLGRFGIDVGGHEKKGLAEVRCSMHVFAYTSIARKASLSSQLAAIGALLSLLPAISFRDIIGKELEELTSKSAEAKLIKGWFFDLSQAQQSLVLNLFGDERKTPLHASSSPTVGDGINNATFKI